MDIKIGKEFTGEKNFFESYAKTHLTNYFEKYSFIQSIKVFFRGKKHPTKKVKLQARFKGKDVFVEASGVQYDEAFDRAVIKLKTHIEKYKTKRYRKAS